MNAYELAKAEVGTVEWAKGNNPKVVAYFKDSGNPGVTDDETAWCAAFVGAMLKRAGIKGTGKLNARSYLDWGTPVERKNAQPGDVVVFRRGNSSWQGHVAFFVKDRGALIEVLGGNQSNAVNVKGYQASALLGIRRPPKAQFKKTAKTEHEPPVMSKTTPVSDISAKAPKRPAPREVAAPQSTPAKGGGWLKGLFTGGALAGGGWIAAKWDAVTQGWADFWLWAFSFIN